jgi:epoxyqueuosine reductase
MTASGAKVVSDLDALAEGIRRRARQIGFDVAGIAPSDPSRYRAYFRQWLDEGQAGSMQYLQRRFDERVDPAVYLPEAASVICVAMNYHAPLEPVAPEGRRYQGRIARYALGDDYHEVLKAKLHTLADWIRAEAPGAQTRACVDTAPVMEKDLAARAGVGWLGKNCCTIHPRLGSWLLLGEIVTTLALAGDEPAIDRCGSCTRCIDACPTGAITGPYQFDARRCISYLTIEHRDPVPAEFHSAIGDWLYGCDICQDVCPWNGKAPFTEEEQFHPRFASGSLDVRDVLGWSDEDYRKQLRGSAMKRVKLPILQRNAQIVADNLGKGHVSTR